MRSEIEIGYRINESYWQQGISTKVIKAMVEYLFDEIKINRIQATVMPENIYSAKALLRNSFIKEGTIREANYWTGKGMIETSKTEERTLKIKVMVSLWAFYSFQWKVSPEKYEFREWR